MTNKEAIDYLNGHYLAYVEGIQTDREAIDKHNAVMDMAIEALKKQKEVNPEIESVSEREILNNCIYLMGELFTDFVEWYRFVHGDDAIAELTEEERFRLKVSHFHIVQRLFLWGTHHSGGTSTRQKCRELGIDDATDTITFVMGVEE